MSLPSLNEIATRRQEPSPRPGIAHTLNTDPLNLPCERYSNLEHRYRNQVVFNERTVPEIVFNTDVGRSSPLAGSTLGPRSHLISSRVCLEGPHAREVRDQLNTRASGHGDLECSGDEEQGTRPRAQAATASTKGGALCLSSAAALARPSAGHSMYPHEASDPEIRCFWDSFCCAGRDKKTSVCVSRTTLHAHERIHARLSSPPAGCERV